ncbi:MAG: ribosome maturation factor RimP [Clostridia bacterium]|nr:ribosome maturation factor RimP [Clostridia bacterium]MBR2323861.1 ribosome maturation factor RimP [Clostridia bacterium]MBR2397424.1 ribosome maturation factor RimP [Clostridia bacterium]MBR2496571.1 ribosome maturation factor RimP [Clostridia bacterium]
MSKVCDIALKAIKPTLDEMGVEVVDMEYKGGRKGEYPSLWIYVYHEDGVDLDLLEKVHRAIDPVLDEADPTDNAPYTLNVSSPGLDRPFKTERDFERNLGKDVEVKLYTLVDGKKTYEGTLLRYKEELVIEIDGKEKAFEKKNLAKVSLAIKFD